jgi:hypothetical protein
MFSSRNSNRPPVEELIIYALLMITGAIPVTNAVQDGCRFGVEATIGAIMIGAGGLGVITYAWAAAHRRRDAKPQSTAGDGGGSRNR